MLEDTNLKGIERLRGREVSSAEGEKLGSIDRVYYDRVTEMPLWFALDKGPLGGRELLVPVAGMELDGNRVRVPYSAAQVRNQPEANHADGLTPEDETTLLGYFGLGKSPQRDSH